MTGVVSSGTIGRMNGWFGLGVALVLALVGAALWLQLGPRKSGILKRDRRMDTARRARVQILLDLPQKAQFELMKYYEQRSSILPLDVGTPAIALMLEKGILREEGGVVAITEEFALALKDWIGAESRRSIRGSYEHDG